MMGIGKAIGRKTDIYLDQKNEFAFFAVFGVKNSKL